MRVVSVVTIHFQLLPEYAEAFTNEVTYTVKQRETVPEEIVIQAKKIRIRTHPPGRLDKGEEGGRSSFLEFFSTKLIRLFWV